ncbi:MAG: hypothetical protein IPG06_05615 [Haliea sp.]|nr:hypothetical protein [Haliea sp.]
MVMLKKPVLKNLRSSAAPHKLMQLSSLEPIRVHVDFACVSRGGDVVLIGWLYDPQEQVQGFDVLRDSQHKSALLPAPGVGSSPDGAVRIGLTRVARPDVAQVMDKGASAPSSTTASSSWFREWAQKQD